MKYRKIVKSILINPTLVRIRYRALKPFFHSKCEMSLIEARTILLNLSPRLTGKCYTVNDICKPIVDLQIIIPAYNVESYIEECLDSLLSQKTSFTFKAVVIEDGSTDKTSEILKKYENNPLVEIIHQKNKGLSGARNTALSKIEGKYITFLDSDDILLSNAIENLMRSALANDADIVEGSYYSFFEGGITSECIHKANNNITVAFGNLRGFAWGKVIRTSLFKNLKFPEGFWFEDTILAYLVYPRCKKVTTIKDMVYGYRKNPNGISATSRRSKKSIDTYWITEAMFENISYFEIEKTQELYEQTLSQIRLNYRRTKGLENKVKQSIFVLTADMFQKEFNGFTTQKNYYHKDLEKALRNNDFRAYALIGEMK